VPDIVLTTGADNSGVARGLAELRNEVAKSGREIRSTFAGAFSISTIVGVALEEGIRGLTRYGAQIYDLSRRFGVSTDALQAFGNAAERNGASLEAVAGGFNKLEIARSRALGGNTSLIESFGRLNVTYADLVKLSPEQLMLKIASSSMDASDMVKVLGRNSLQLRETLEALGSGFEHLDHVISVEHIEALKHAEEAWIRLYEAIKVLSGNYVLGPIAQGFDEITTGFQKTAARFQEDGEIIIRQAGNVKDALAKLFSGDFAGAKGEAFDFLKGFVTPSRVANPPRPPLKPREDAGGAFGNADLEQLGAGGGGRGGLTLDEVIDKENKAAQAQLSNREKLLDLDQQRADLQDQLDDEPPGTPHELELRSQIADVDKDIAETRKKIGDEEAAYNDELEHEVDAAERTSQQIESQNRLLELQRRFGTDIGTQMFQQEQLTSQIADLTDDINEAWSEGKEELADQLTTMRQQLQTQRDLLRERQNAQNRQNLVNSLQDQVASDPYAAAFAGSEVQAFLARLRAAHLNPLQYAPRNPQEASYLDIIRHVMDAQAEQATIGRANQLVTQANEPRSVAGEISFLQGTAIPGVRSLINPSEPFNIAQQLNAQLQTLEQMLTQLQDLNKVVKPPPGG
jgi:hypothetical protein